MAAVIDLQCMVRSLAAIDISALDGDDLKLAVLEPQASANAAGALASSVSDEFERRGAWADEGARSGAGWAAARTGSSKAALQAQLGAGRALRGTAVGGPARQGRLSATPSTSTPRASGWWRSTGATGPPTPPKQTPHLGRSQPARSACPGPSTAGGCSTGT